MALSYFDEEVGTVEELWVTDGTAAGTHAVQSFSNGAIFNLTAIGDRVYFQINDGVDGFELWTSNGTTSGTLLVKDIWPGANSSNPTDLTNFNGELYFEANDGSHVDQLWKTDGTASGTMM